jgi:16S rRNA (guanine(966)-N(2))-methyltransferase RsmD
MRIIAGKYRGRRLKSPPSLRTRPTSDRLRETLFNILAPWIEGARFLDLCSGTGAVGIEALSRGAQHVTFVDQSKKMGALIKANLAMLQVAADEYEIVTTETSEFLRRKANSKLTAYDIVFFDPPYASDYAPALSFLGRHGDQLLSDEGLITVEHHTKKELPDAAGNLKRYRLLKQGDAALSFYKRTG